MADIEETMTESTIDTSRRELLDGFKQAKVKIHFLSGNLEKLTLKKKFIKLFDIGVLSVHSANNIKEEMSLLFKNNAKIHVESCDYMVIFKPEQRQQFREKVVEKAMQARWVEIKDGPYQHHMLFEVNSS